MKVNRYGRAKILTQSEIQQIFAIGLTNDRDRALFAFCLFSACRIREAVTLQTTDIYTPNGKVRSQLIISKFYPRVTKSASMLSLFKSMTYSRLSAPKWRSNLARAVSFSASC
ncbi:hypothetical protein [Nostoc sp.]|uniref:hypothetical protein n=1 Tax=Nostoc sp. TaxID=1180 RepID=UPI002FF5243B